MVPSLSGCVCQQFGAGVPSPIRRVVPIFLQEGANFSFDFGAKPLFPVCLIGQRAIRRDIRVSDSELGPERHARCNFLVQRANRFFDTDDQIRHQAPLCAPIAPCLAEIWDEVDEGEAAAESQVNDSKRAIRYVHSTDHKEIFRYVDATLTGLSIGEFNGLGGSPFGVFEESKHLAENLRRITPVDFFNDEHEGAIGLAGGSFDALAGRFHRQAQGGPLRPACSRGQNLHRQGTGETGRHVGES